MLVGGQGTLTPIEPTCAITWAGSAALPTASFHRGGQQHRPKPRDYRPLLTATDIPGEPRKRPIDPRLDERTPLRYPAGFGYDDSKI